MLRANLLIWLNRYSIMEHLLTTLCSYGGMVSFSVVFTGGSFCLENVLDDPYLSVWSSSSSRQVPQCICMALAMSPTRLVIDFTNQVNFKRQAVKWKINYISKGNLFYMLKNMIKSKESLEIEKECGRQRTDYTHTEGETGYTKKIREI